MSVEKYAVIGHPIAHSKSPLIHQAFAQQFGKTIVYDKVLAPLDGFLATVQELQQQGYLGANVTVPFKFEAFDLSQTLSERAQAAGAVNTLSFSQAHIQGDNTDGCGLVNDILKHHQTTLVAKRILLLGAGGAAQGVMLPLIAQRPAQVTVANRSQDKAKAMLDKFATEAQQFEVSLVVTSFTDLNAPLNEPYDVVINATSAGLTDTPLALSSQLFSAHTLAYDMMYGRETPFMQQARLAGAKVADGLGMLIEQAAEAFFIWHGLRPDTAPVIQAFR